MLFLFNLPPGFYNLFLFSPQLLPKPIDIIQ